MQFFSSLFQSKSHLPPFFRSLAIYLETQIVGIALTGLLALSQYFHANSQIDPQGLLNFLWASVALSVGKAFTGLVPQVQHALQQQFNAPHPAPQPVVNNITVQHPAQAVVSPPAQTPVVSSIPQRPQATFPVAPPTLSTYTYPTAAIGSQQPPV